MIELRRAVPEDLDCLFEAANSAFAGSTVSGKGPRWKCSREFLGDCLAEQECWCILLDGRTVGGLILFPQPDCLWLEGCLCGGGPPGGGHRTAGPGGAAQAVPGGHMAAQDPGGGQTGLPFLRKAGLCAHRYRNRSRRTGVRFVRKENILAILMDKVLTSCLRSGNMGFINLTRVIGGEYHAPIP